MTVAPHPLIAAALAMPHTHVVVTRYRDGKERRFTTRSAASAEMHAIEERRKIGRDLIDRMTGETVRVISVEVGRIDVAELVAMPVGDRAQAEAFIDRLFDIGLGYHFDDGPVDCLHGNGLVSLAEAETIEDKLAEVYAAWEESGADLRHDCPIGHALKALERIGAA